MRHWILTICCFLITASSFANHLKGGWIQYNYVGPGGSPNSSRYEIIVRQYLDCSASGQQIDAIINLGIFNSDNNTLFQSISVPLSGTDILNKRTFDPCISPTPTVCYRIDIYRVTVDLPANNTGFDLTVQRCCRINGIMNLSSPSNQVGVTYTSKIPGVNNGVRVSNNSSPVFAQRDTAVVCFNTPFTFDFSAVDADGDSLSYTFCTGLNGGGQNNPVPQPVAPPYSPVFYSTGYDASSPLGGRVQIDSKTGIIQGFAPDLPGDYVVAVCALEFRNGLLIGSIKKEIHITVANCQLSAARLDPDYISCDGFTLDFENRSTSAGINSYFWDFGVPNIVSDTSSRPRPTYTFPDTGTFTMKLRVTNAGGCKDSTTATVRIYPGFEPAFDIIGSCILNPYEFRDRTFVRYGAVNSWQWDFGEPTLTNDTARIANPSFLYPTLGTKTIRLRVTSTKGCDKEITRTIQVLDKPQLDLPFRDTLICSIDTLELRVNARGLIQWSPNNRLIDARTANPRVYPTDTTVYYVRVEENGCINTDSVKVNVLPFITVRLGADTGICRTDSIQLRPVSEALQFLWTPSIGLSNPNAKNPLAAPLTSTGYRVTANLGKCQDSDSIFIRVTPYPEVNVSGDRTICFGEQTTLQASIIASSFQWRPNNAMLNAQTLTPTVAPSRTTAYILEVSDTLGCPKLVTDTVLITVRPPVSAFAGRDTAVVRNQPLQLQASGGTAYRWSPTLGLNNSLIADPIATLNTSQDSIRYIVTVTDEAGCTATDDIWVRIFQTEPDLFVPTAFTPNRDGRNDVLRAIPVGISRFDHFRIYNRVGQLIFQTTDPSRGWDGTIGGQPQPAGTYVFTAQGEDYRGRPIFRKGTTVLIR